MQTYLDYYAQGLAAKFANQATAETAKERKFWKDITASDGMALKYVANNSLSIFFDTKHEEALNSLSEAMVETLLFQSKLVPFLNAHDMKPLAYQLTPQVLRSLAAADVSPDIKRFGREIAEEHGSVYIDTPSNDYVLNGRYALRAMIVETSGVRLSKTENDQVQIGVSGLKDCLISFTAVFYDLEERTYRRIAWDEGSDHITGKGLLNWQSVIMEKADVETKDIMSDLENLFWLTLAYVKTEEENGDVEYNELPHLHHDHVRRQGRKASQVAKNFASSESSRLQLVAALNGQRVPTLSADCQALVQGDMMCEGISAFSLLVSVDPSDVYSGLRLSCVDQLSAFRSMTSP